MDKLRSGDMRSVAGRWNDAWFLHWRESPVVMSAFQALAIVWFVLGVPAGLLTWAAAGADAKAATIGAVVFLVPLVLLVWAAVR